MVSLHLFLKNYATQVPSVSAKIKFDQKNEEWKKKKKKKKSLSCMMEMERVEF